MKERFTIKGKTYYRDKSNLYYDVYLKNKNFYKELTFDEMFEKGYDMLPYHDGFIPQNVSKYFIKWDKHSGWVQDTQITEVIED